MLGTQTGPVKNGFCPQPSPLCVQGCFAPIYRAMLRGGNACQPPKYPTLSLKPALLLPVPCSLCVEVVLGTTGIDVSYSARATLLARVHGLTHGAAMSMETGTLHL